MNAVKTNLKRLRLAKKLTQDDLAEKLHVVRQTVSSWETGKTTPDVETLTAIAQALEADISELIYGVKPADIATPTTRRQTALLCIVTLLLALLAVSLRDILPNLGVGPMMSPVTFRPDIRSTIVWSVVSFFLPSLAYCLAGISFLSVLRLWKPGKLPERPLCVVLAVLGGTPLLFYWVMVVNMDLSMILSAMDMEWPFVRNFSAAYWFCQHQYLFFLSGLLLAPGSFRKKP